VIFRHLILENFGAYAGRNRLDLEPVDNGKPVVLVGGQNGEGKTTILEAIQLALYGPHSMSMNGNTGSYEKYLSSRVSRTAARGERASIELCVALVHGGTELEVEVRRSWGRGERVREKLEVSTGGRSDKQLTEGWAEFMEAVVPRGVAPLFFFDGERIEELADLDSAARTLQTAVGALLGLELVDQLGADLKALERRHAEKAGSPELRAELEGHDARIADLDAELSIAKSELAALRARLDQAKAKQSRADQRFAKEGGHSYELRIERESSAEVARTRLQDSYARLREEVSKEAPLCLVADQISALVRSGAEQKRTEIAAAVVQVLEARDREAVSHIASNPELSQQLKRWLDDDRERRAPVADSTSSRPLSADVLRNAESMVAGGRLKEAERKLDALIEATRQAATELEDAESRLAEVPSQDAITSLIAERERARFESTRLETEVSDAMSAIEGLEGRRRRAAEDQERALRRAADEGLSAEDSSRILVHSERARKTLALLRAKSAEHHMHRIESLILESLAVLLRKQRLVKGVRIDPKSYELHLLGRNGEPLDARRLSAGERQLTALALLWGLARAAARALPVVIDTPLGRLDATHRKLFVGGYLPNASHQVIVLSTDTEVDGDLFQKLSPVIGREYHLTHDDESGTTSVEEGYFFSRQLSPELAAA
jgi:DNA sulfur modification protein DndD